MIHITDKHNCCGCEACVQACPKQCISFNEDSEGFRYPKVDASFCVECGACERTCPVLKPFESRMPARTLAAINPDGAVRAASSSGGLFTMLAENVISRGGVVFGVRFDDIWEAVFDYTDNTDGLAVFRGSKYVQARVGEAFSKVKDFLKSGRKVLFSGTPCQIAGLLHYLQRDYDNLIAVDFICHGAPSPKVWKLYLDEVTQNTRRAIRDVQFRSKRQGWKKFNFDMTYDKDGNTINLSSWHQRNHFMRIFLQDVILRPSCYACRAKGGRSGSDITMADFWGIERLNPQMDDDKGTSLVMVHSRKGSDLYALCHIPQQWETAYGDILRLNPAAERSARQHPKREQFFSQLDSAPSLITLIDDTLRIPLPVRIRRLPWRILRKGHHALQKLIGGGKSLQSDSAAAKQECMPQSILPWSGEYNIECVTFRSKSHGWKEYRMAIGMAAAKHENSSAPSSIL